MELTASDQEPKPDAPRPILVTIVALLILVGSLFALIVGIFAYIQREALLSYLRSQPLGSNLGVVTLDTVLNFAVILLGYGAIHLAIAYGLWTGRNWARRVSLLLSVIGLIVFLPGVLIVPQLSLPVVAFAAFILYYFTRPRVKEFFKY